MCHGRAGAPVALIVPPAHSSLSLSEVSSLYWMVQKQNHKPISVTLAMRLDGPNLSPSGAIGSTPASPPKTPFSQTEGAFCLATFARDLSQFTGLTAISGPAPHCRAATASSCASRRHPQPTAKLYIECL